MSLLIGIALLAGTSSALAETSGRIINAPYFDISQRILFSQNDYVFGTSRSSAMGGAFTSLGADLSSMNINPAGLGMYQSSDWGITQGLSITGINTSSPNMQPGNFSSGGTRTSYGLDNVAIVFNTYNKARTLTSLSFGFGYNRTANFNSNSYARASGNNVSIANMFSKQLDVMANMSDPIGPADLQSSARPFEDDRIYFDEWGAVLGYQSGMLTNSGGNYGIALGPNAETESFLRSVTKGGIYEYNFSLGANISNFLYLGASIGASQIQYKELLTYEETFSNQSSDFVGKLWYDQNTHISGAGFTMKLGAVVRPVEPLRIGVAFHLPTYYTINKYYTGEMGTDIPRSANTGRLEDELRFNTAPKLLVGASVVMGSRAILAVDYECAWYNKIRTRSVEMKDEEASKEESDLFFKPGHTLRAGVEFRVSDVMSLRAGGGYQFSMLNDKYWLANTPVAHSGYNVTAGLGFNVGRNAYIDVAYLFKHSNYTGYENYYFKDGGNWAYQYDNLNGNDIPREYIQKKNYHLISLTIGSRF